MSHDASINFLIALAIIALVAGVLLAEKRQQEIDMRLCRHTIQRAFHLEREEAERLIEAERRWSE